MSVSRLTHITPIGVEQMGALADSLSDPDVLRLENLDTDLRPPTEALQFSQQAVMEDDANSYLPFLGLEVTRKAATHLVAQQSGQSYDWKTESLISAGGLSGILNVLLATLEEGDEVLMTDPTYVGLINRVRLAGGVPRYVSLLETEDGWRLDTDQLQLLDKSSIKLALIMSPSMPTGAVLNEQEWQAITDFCLEADAWLLYDAAMERILFDGRKVIHPASFPGMREKVITVGAASKEYRMIGWRVGWIVGPAEIIADVASVSISNVVCQTGIAMGAVAKAIHAEDDGIRTSSNMWQERRDVMMEELSAYKLINPHGGWSLLWDVSPLGLTGSEASKILLEKGNIAATPMIHWGTERTKHFIRLVYSNEPVERLKGIGARVKEAFSVLVCLLAFGVGFVPMSHSQTHRPNIVLINIDDMGWRDVGFMGSEYYETPHLDALAKEGMVFSQGYASAANCAPSRASLMTGKWTPRHGIYTVASSERGQASERKLIPIKNTITLTYDHKTIAEILAGFGYVTCHAGKWHLSEDPLMRGFDVNIGGNHAGNPGSYTFPYRNVPLGSSNDEYLTDLIMSKVIDFVEAAESPFFLYYSPYAVHTPIQGIDSLRSNYEGKAAWEGQSHIDYATMVENLDRNIGLLIATLKEKELMDNTFLIFTSDNGGVYGITEQRPLRAGKGSYYEGGIRVPFFFVWADHIDPNTQNETPITNLDIFPTILEVAKIGDWRYIHDGDNLLPLLTGKGSLPTRPLYWHFPIYLQAYDVNYNQSRDPLFRTRPGSVIRYGPWKLHHYFEDDGIELYDLSKDIGEHTNVADAHPDKVKELYSRLDRWRTRTGAPIPIKQNPQYRGN